MEAPHSARHGSGAAAKPLCYIYTSLMNRHPKRQLRVVLALGAALLLRAAIPAGYMPAGADSGPPVSQFCPEGVPAEFMQMLAGGHAEHHEDVHAGHSPDHQCPIGHLLLSAAAVDNPWHDDVSLAAPVFEALPVRVLTGTTRTHYHSRGPPA